MIVCPLCEHTQQQGTTCDNCGKQLAAPAPVNLTAETMPELESTALSGAAANILIEKMPDLAEHRVGDVQVPPDDMPDIEQTRFPNAATAAGEAVPELERTAFAGDGQRTALPAYPTCRYCGFAQVNGGIVCDNCGRALPVYRRSESAAAVASGPAKVACPTCGVAAEIGKRCLSCGSYIRTPTV